MMSLKEFRWIALMAVLVIVIAAPGTVRAQSGTGAIRGVRSAAMGQATTEVSVVRSLRSCSMSAAVRGGLNS